MKSFDVTQADLHPHLEARMRQRGVTLEEVKQTMAKGWECTDAKSGTYGKVMVFSFNSEWVGRFYPEKEVTVYYKLVREEMVLLTVKARYGQEFPRR